MEKITIEKIASLKNKRKIIMLTAYDYPFAYLLDQVGVDMILVGDSLANVVLGLDSTTKVGMQEMLHHTKAVRRAVKNALLIADMPFSAYQVDKRLALDNAKRFIEEAGAEAVKLEWFSHCLEVAEKIIKSGIPVMGHIGLTPQTVDKLGGFRVQGKDVNTAIELIKQAKDLEKIGCFSLVLECVPAKLAELITQRLKIPTIGIGAGPFCDGQVLVIHDLLGLSFKFRPKFVKCYINLQELIKKAICEYKQEVMEGKFPLLEHSFVINEEEFSKLKELLPEI